MGPIDPLEQRHYKQSHMWDIFGKNCVMYFVQLQEKITDCYNWEHWEFTSSLPDELQGL